MLNKNGKCCRDDSLKRPVGGKDLSELQKMILEKNKFDNENTDSHTLRIVPRIPTKQQTHRQTELD